MNLTFLSTAYFDLYIPESRYILLERATDPLLSKRILLIVFTGIIKCFKLLWTGSVVFVLLFFRNPLEYNGINRF